MNNVVDTGNFVFTSDAEAHGLLDCEAQDQSHDEGVDQDCEGRNRLDRELTEVSAGEQSGVDGEESEEQGSDQTRDQV